MPRSSAHTARATINEFLELIEHGAGSATSCEDQLPALLDRLAVLQHEIVVPDHVSVGLDAPRRNHHELRALICERFPTYGLYNTALQVLDVPNEEFGIGDAIDDLLDITIELYEVAWYWEQSREAEALWYLRFSFEAHWEEHLRSLQLYLCHVRNDRR